MFAASSNESARESLLLNLGQDKKDIKVVIEEGANHSEDSWRRRFPEFLEWVLKE